MAILAVENVGPIKQATLEIKKYTVLIGPQGSGKSTLAKLVAIGTGEEMWPSYGYKSYSRNDAYRHYQLDEYLIDKSRFSYKNEYYEVIHNEKSPELSLTEKGFKREKSFIHKQIAENGHKYDYSFTDEERRVNNSHDDMSESKRNIERDVMLTLSHNNFKKDIISFYSLYIPSERTILSILASSIWSLLNSNVNLPKTILSFGAHFEEANRVMFTMHVPFLDINFVVEDQKYFIESESKGRTRLSKGASGYQAVLPLLKVVECYRNTSLSLDKHHFIIEEPELNLYPQAQKNLIYSLISGMYPELNQKESKWLFTTHSPYVLSSLNTLMLAYKVGSQDEESSKEVEKIIPKNQWINPEDFSAYYIADGTARSIVDPATGLIQDNELDKASEVLADELDTLFSLYRPQTHA